MKRKSKRLKQLLKKHLLLMPKKRHLLLSWKRHLLSKKRLQKMLSWKKWTWDFLMTRTFLRRSKSKKSKKLRQ